MKSRRDLSTRSGRAVTGAGDEAIQGQVPFPPSKHVDGETWQSRAILEVYE